MIKISIIIPIYNAERFLERCINSVLESLKASKINGEILLVNNNSTDNSVKIMEETAKRHSKIVKILHCPVQGLSETRNYGEKRAKGEYIWFIDADDAISKNAISKLLEQAEKKKADIVMMGAERIYPDGRKNYLSAVNAADKDYKSRFIRYGVGPWQVVIRRKWWEQNKFSFKERVIHEDMELMSALILYTERFSSIDEPFYFYYQNPGSILHRSNFNPHIFDIFPNLEDLYKRFARKKAEKTYHDELEWFFIWNLLIDSARDFAQFPEGKPGFKRSRDMLHEYFPNWRRNRFLKQKPLKLKILVRLNYYR